MVELAYVGLGSNLGDRPGTIREAIRRLRRVPGVKVRRVSSLRETEPEGVADQPPFLNGAVELECALTPADLLEHLLRVENGLGRVRRKRWGPRPIDLDLLLFGSRRIATERLTLPHPRLTERLFVLEPLTELCPDRIVPGTRRTVRRHLELLGEAAHA